MLTNGLRTVAEAVDMISRGRVLLVAGDEDLLRQLPSGTWIGGTAASFMTEDGGVTDHKRVFVTDLTEIAESATAKRYTADKLSAITGDYPASGFTVLIIPAGSDSHSRFAKEVQGYPGVFNNPLVGWISAVDVSELGKRQPSAFAGSPVPTATDAVALHVALKPGLAAQLDIINLFTPGDGDAITFEQEGFSASDCFISGKRANLARYILDKAINTKLPLTADYSGAMINVSIRSVDAATGQVQFYAPVFPGVEYRLARPVADYTHAFEALGNEDTAAFSCNCVLNFLYAELEGKKVGTFNGPITFGEIAYMLLNQTLVYLKIVNTA